MPYKQVKCIKKRILFVLAGCDFYYICITIVMILYCKFKHFSFCPQTNNRMKKLFLFLITIPMVLLLPEYSDAHPKSLFVNDNGLFLANTDTVLSALTAAGIPCDVFNARDSLRSPTSAEMQAYPLVIWYCSTDGVGNYLWNASDSDNAELMEYLSNGGKLWLMGTDFMYDRYGGAPDVFGPGDFVYDFLGISAYEAQSYGDDGGFGVPQLDPVDLPGNPAAHDILRWIFSTAWWVDGCTPTENAVSVYDMGPVTYAFHGLSSAILNNYLPSDSNKRLSFFFDPAIIDTYNNRVALFEWSYYALFPPSLPGIKPLPKDEVILITGMNQGSGTLQCQVPESIGNKFSVGIADICGRQKLARLNETQKGFSIDISSLSAGMYILTVSDNKKTYHQKFVTGK
jgi:hypothetical protein